MRAGSSRSAWTCQSIASRPKDRDNQAAHMAFRVCESERVRPPDLKVSDPPPSSSGPLQNSKRRLLLKGPSRLRGESPAPLTVPRRPPDQEGALAGRRQGSLETVLIERHGAVAQRNAGNHHPHPKPHPRGARHGTTRDIRSDHATRRRTERAPPASVSEYAETTDRRGAAGGATGPR